MFDYDMMTDAQVAKIIGAKGARAYFLKNTPNCPGGANCQTKAFVIPNDLVVVNQVTDDFVCGMFVSNSGVETKGWLKGAQVQIDMPQAPLDAWTGKWKTQSGDNELTIKKVGTSLSVAGMGIFRTGGGSANTGDFSAKAKPENGRLQLITGGCEVALVHLGNRLYVADNDDCGGLNVRFDGTYKKSWK